MNGVGQASLRLIRGWWHRWSRRSDICRESSCRWYRSERQASVGYVIARVVHYGLVDCIESAASLTRGSLRLSDGHSLPSHERVLLDVFEWRYRDRRIVERSLRDGKW